MDGTSREAPDDLVIRLTSLEQEWCKQPKLADEWYAKLASANFDVDELKLDVEVAKEDLEQTDARLSLQIRQTPTNGKPLTEAAIASTIATHPEHKEAKERYFAKKRMLNKAVRVAALTDATVHGLEHKKKGLEKCVELLIGNFYSRPKDSAVTKLEEQNKRDDFRLGRPRPRDRTT